MGYKGLRDKRSPVKMLLLSQPLNRRPRMVSINQALRSVKEDLAKLLEPESIFSICREAGHKWRKSRLNPAVLIHLFVMQILSGNTACTHLRHLSGLAFTASAYCQARKRLPLKVSNYWCTACVSSWVERVMRVPDGWATACGVWTVRARRCPTHPSYKDISVSRVVKNLVVDSPWPPPFPSCMPGQDCC